jgi:hypothetical protein
LEALQIFQLMIVDHVQIIMEFTALRQVISIKGFVVIHLNLVAQHQTKCIVLME